jgi:hypothetical protein
MRHKVELEKFTYFLNTSFPFRYLYTLPSFVVGRQSSYCVTWRSRTDNSVHARMDATGESAVGEKLRTE